MYNYRLTGLNPLSLGLFFFLCGVLVGGAGGLLLGLIDRSITGIAGGLFLGFMFGLFSGLSGLVYAVAFNALSPLFGGLPVRLDSVTATTVPPEKEETPPAASGDATCTGSGLSPSDPSV